MTQECETYILDRFGNWLLSEDDWYKPEVSEDTSLDEEADVKSELELTLDEKRSISSPVMRALHTAKNYIASKTSEAAAEYDGRISEPAVESAYK